MIWTVKQWVHDSAAAVLWQYSTVPYSICLSWVIGWLVLVCMSFMRLQPCIDWCADYCWMHFVYCHFVPFIISSFVKSELCGGMLNKLINYTIYHSVVVCQWHTNSYFDWIINLVTAECEISSLISTDSLDTFVPWMLQNEWVNVKYMWLWLKNFFNYCSGVTCHCDWLQREEHLIV